MIIFVFFLVGGGGVLHRILSGAVPPGSSNPELISDKKSNFPHLFSDLGVRQKLCYDYMCIAV